MSDSTLDEALGLWREAVLPVAARQRVELSTEAELRAPPMVLLLGNHSSGKSSLINDLLGQDVQRTGVAPTDDGFTLLFDGEGEILNGETLTARPDLPFGRLRRFGPALLRHLKGTPVRAPVLQRVWLVDSPGMIDSGGEARRPYDFEAVVRSLAEQADLVLLLFDPEKPGTTGETVRILARALGGFEDRLRIVMNKMDLFTDLRDFARAYGALCWNLSRALKRQDVPHIYTTSLPGRGGLSPESFAEARAELAEDIRALPARRRDSTLARMRADARRVLLRARVTEALRGEVRAVWLRAAGLTAGLAALGVAGSWLAPVISNADSAPGAITLIWVGFALAFMGLGAYSRAVAQRVARRGPGELDRVFEALFRERLALGDEELRGAWEGTGEELAKHLATVGLRQFAPVGGRALRRLERVLEVDLPRLHEQLGP